MDDPDLTRFTVKKLVVGLAAMAVLYIGFKRWLQGSNR